jgi:hypothetical protein
MSPASPAFAVRLTGERMMAKNTGGRDRPTPDEIARLAYHFYETRMRQQGSAIDDWLSAERELTNHYRSALKSCTVDSQSE